MFEEHECENFLMFKEKYPESIHVSFYPYTYVRVMAMKGKLYKKQDYDKLLKMQGNEIAKYLEEAEYKEEIHLLGKEFEGYELVEQALYANFIKSRKKLQTISSPEMVYLLNAYFKKYDVYNIKTVLRAKAVKQQKQETEKLLLPLGKMTKEKLLALLDAESMAAILKKIGLREIEYKEALEYWEKEASLLELENMLDQKWYKKMQEFIKLLAGEHKLFKELLQAEIDVMNIKLLLRVKKARMETKRISSLFFRGGAFFSKTRLDELAEKDFEIIISTLKTTTFRKIIEKHEAELVQKDLRTFEKSLDVWLLGRATLLLHQFPLSVDTLLGYMVAKEIEMRNLRVLVKGKQFGLEEKFIEEQLVIA